MPAKWTGRLVGLMHVHGITHEDLAAAAGWSRPYTTMWLNTDLVNPKARARLTEALDWLIAQKRAEG